MERPSEEEISLPSLLADAVRSFLLLFLVLVFAFSFRLSLFFSFRISVSRARFAAGCRQFAHVKLLLAKLRSGRHR